LAGWVTTGVGATTGLTGSSLEEEDSEGCLATAGAAGGAGSSAEDSEDAEGEGGFATTVGSLQG